MAKSVLKRSKNILFYGFVAFICLSFSGLSVAASLGAITKSKTVVKSIKLPAVPALTVKQVGTTAVLKWGKPAKGITFANYNVYRSEQAGKLGQDIGQPKKTDLTFSDVKVVVGHTYYYSIKYAGKNTITPNGRQLKIKIIATKENVPKTSPSSDILKPTKTPSAVTPPSKEPDIFSNPNPTVAPITDMGASTQDKERLMTIKQLQLALASYFAAQGMYPEGTDLILGAGETTCLNTDGWGSSDDCPYPYFGSIPKDPGMSAYTYTSSGDSFTLYNTLDGKVDNFSGTIMLSPAGIVQK